MKLNKGFVLSIDALLAVVIAISLFSIMYGVMNETKANQIKVYDTFGEDIAHVVCSNGDDNIALFFELENYVGLVEYENVNYYGQYDPNLYYNIYEYDCKNKPIKVSWRNKE